ncbi:pyrimidine deaminase RibD-like protein/NTP pyrophosphatase (non-canonical NTP hydrolase) [Bradyrhizobium japonicum]
MTDEQYMQMAIEEARKCHGEDSRIHPKVGAVAVLKSGEVIAAHRGELADGEHAEFTILEKKAKDKDLVGATIYTTLEPCTHRNHPKVPCADRLVERKVGRVVIGMLDPNPIIQGKGQSRLRDANIDIATFPAPLASRVEDLNREFRRDQQKKGELNTPDAARFKTIQSQSLDTWYHSINRTYWNRNYDRDVSSIFTHLVEVIGGMSSLASNKRKAGIEPERHIAKALAWWLTLCGKLGIKSVEEMIWDKFPFACPYCQQGVHNQDICSQKKAEGTGVSWDTLAQLGKNKERPGRLSAWQMMFQHIYPAGQTEEYGPSFARLTEELGELAEAVRIFKAEPGYILSEAADVFAWLMHIQNIRDTKQSVSAAQRGNALEKVMSEAYPTGCPDCNQTVCACPPILPKTIGRIAHEVPKGRGTFGAEGRFMPPDKASKFFLLD